MLTSFDHLTIVANDLDAAVERYQQLLGASPTWRGLQPELGTHSALFGLSNALVELVAPLPGAEQGDAMRELLATRGEHLLAIAFATDDADACSTQLRARGVRASLPQVGEAQDTQGTRSYRTVDLSPRTTRGLSAYIVERADMERLRPHVTRSADAVFALDHVAIRTSDPDAAIALYGNALGIRLALDTKLGNVRMLFFRIGGVTIEVIEDRSLDTSDAFYGATYRVRDMDGAHARIAAAGFAVNDVRTGMKPGTRVFSVKDGTCGVPTLILRDPGRDGA